jgi:hypothetical protein
MKTFKFPDVGLISAAVFKISGTVLKTEVHNCVAS